MAIAPWLQQPDYLGAMTRGAGLGLQARAQDTRDELAAEREASAGDRLRLAYNQLYEKEKMAHEAAQARQEQATAILNLRGQQQAMLQDYRERNMDRLAQQNKESMDLRNKMAENTLTAQADKLEQARKFHEDLQAERLKRDEGRVSDAVRLQQQSINAKRRSLTSTLNNPTYFNQAVEEYKMRYPGRDDEVAKSTVAQELQLRLDALDDQEEGLQLTPTTKGRLVYKDGKIVEE